MNLEHSTIRPSTHRPVVLAGIVLAFSLTGLTAPAANADSDPADARFGTTGVTERTAAPVTQANGALARAVAQLRGRHPRKAARELRTLRTQTDRAHTSAMGLIGKPPTDPESDVPPGPAAVLAVLSLEHRTGTTLVPLFNGLRRSATVSALGSSLGLAQVRRNTMLARVVALPVEGAGEDYADGMSDTLGWYSGELKQLSTGLASYRLTSAGDRSLAAARLRVTAASEMMDKSYGGGE